MSCLQVGSKNAAFFMGQAVKVTTKTADSPYVHELALVAAELEQRYKDSKVKARLKPRFDFLHLHLMFHLIFYWSCSRLVLSSTAA